MLTKRTQQHASARIPTEDGSFHLHLYHDQGDDKEHLALVYGDVEGAEDVLVRVHSECFTGDVLGSMRCDCGPQLQEAMRLISAETCGIILYLRQEGRGIGLAEKLRAYNLQDSGLDTVDANLALGHHADARDYTIAAHMLNDLGVESIQILTNNPAKVEALHALGIDISARVPLETGFNHENAGYLATKMRRMRHLLNLERVVAAPTASQNGSNAQNGNGHKTNGHNGNGQAAATHGLNGYSKKVRTQITLTYAQSLDGSIAARPGQTLTLSCPESMQMTHKLRAEHDGILVGIETVLADDPQLTTRLVEGTHARPIILDSHLRFPLTARLLSRSGPKPLIVTTASAETDRQTALERAGAEILRLPANDAGQIDLHALNACLPDYGLKKVMVEGGGRVITAFLKARLVDKLVLTVSPCLVGGVKAVGALGVRLPRLRKPRYQWLGEDMIVSAEIDWDV